MTPKLSPLERIAQQAEQLYSLPAVAMEILRLAGQPQVDPRQIKQCLESDPALAARILKVVNSSLFGLARQVIDLQQALALLGLKPLKALLLGFSLPPALLRGIQADALQRYWQHTLLKAIACRLLEQHVAPSEDEEAFVAGLLQDVGSLALLQQLGENYSMIYLQAQERGENLLKTEASTLGFDHRCLSARMLASWRLPPKLCQAVAVPPLESAVAHAPPQSRELCQILHLAEVLTGYVECQTDGQLATLLDLGERYFGLGPVRLHSLLTELAPHFESLTKTLAVELPSGPSAQELLLAAHRRMSSITAEMVPELLQAARSRDEAAELEAVLNSTRELSQVAQQVIRPTIEIPHAERRADAGSEAIHPAASAPLLRVASPTLATQQTSHGSALDPGVLGRIAGALQVCRQNRSPLTLALLCIDHLTDAQFVCGVERAQRFVETFRGHLAEATGGLGPCVQLHNGNFALLWANCSRSDAVRTLRNVQDHLPAWQDEVIPADSIRLSLSAGVATVPLPSRNFQTTDLVAAAQRCLDGAIHSGGNGVKSIEV